MGAHGPVLRISLGLVLLTSAILMGLDLLGWIPSVESRDAELRVRVAEAVAAQAMSGVGRGDLREVRAILEVAAAPARADCRWL